MNPEAAPNAACLKVWDELTPSERAFAQTLGLDEASWPKWYDYGLFDDYERDYEDDENERNWPEEVVRHSARTAASWMDLTISEREAAQQLGYDQGLWAAFCCSEDDPVHRWSLNECEGEAECWGELHNPRFVYRCAHNCAKIRCPNFEVCGEEGDGFFVNLKGRCLECDMHFGENFDILRGDAAESAEECSVCYDDKAVVKLPQCMHRFCGGCVGRLQGFNGAGGEAPHMNAAGGGVNDKGCPLCRNPTLAPKWAHSGLATCRCCYRCRASPPHCRHECECECDRCGNIWKPSHICGPGCAEHATSFNGGLPYRPRAGHGSIGRPLPAWAQGRYDA